VQGASSPLVTIDSISKKVVIYGTDKANDLGVHRFTIEACHTNVYYQKINCIESDEITVTVQDPCLQTTLDTWSL